MKTFCTTRPLRFGDCDPTGIAYFPSYMNLLVGVTEDFFTSLGFGWRELAKNHSVVTPTVRLDVTFSRPGFQDDRIDFALSVVGVGRSSLDFVHTASVEGQLLWRAEQRIVATSAQTHRACPWPDDLRAALTTHLEPANA